MALRTIAIDQVLGTDMKKHFSVLSRFQVSQPLCVHIISCSDCTQYSCLSWAARYNTWLLIKLTPKGVVFSFVSVCQPHHAALRARDPLVISRQPVLGGRKRVASAYHAD